MLVPLERTKLPCSSRKVEKTQKWEVPEFHNMAPDPSTSCKLPIESNWNEPLESTKVPPPTPPEWTIPTMKEGGEIGGWT